MFALVAISCVLMASWRAGDAGSAQCVGTRGNLDNRALVDLDGLSLDEQRRQSGAGVLLFAYADSPQVLASRLEAATASARRMKTLNPWLRIALATNGEPARGMFDFVVPIEPRHVFDGGEPRPRRSSSGEEASFQPVQSQALTRIYYLARSPFALTLALEGTAVACRGGVDALLASELPAPVDGDGQFDIALSTSMRAGGRGASTTLLLRANAATRALLRDWFVEHLNTDPTGDATPALAKVVARRQAAGVLSTARLNPGFVARVLPVGASARVESADVAFRGPVSFIQATGRAFSPQRELDRLCDLASAGGAKPRLLVARADAVHQPLDKAVTVETLTTSACVGPCASVAPLHSSGHATDTARDASFRVSRRLLDQKLTPRR